MANVRVFSIKYTNLLSSYTCIDVICAYYKAVRANKHYPFKLSVY